MFTYEIRTITPEVAGVMLRERNKNNRNLAKAKVDQYAAAMEEGRWRLTPVPLILEEHTGNILDGQNRLTAVVRSNKSQKFVICTNGTRDIMGVIDQGKSRTASDHMKIQGVDRGTKLAPLLLAIISYNRMPDGLWSHIKPLSNDEYMEAYNNNTEMADEALGFGIQCAKAYKAISCTDFAFTYFLLRSWGFEQKELVDFFNKLSTGAELPDGSPILAFRNYLVNNKDKYSGCRTRRQHSVNNILKTFGLYQADKTITRFVEAGIATPVITPY